MRKSIRLAIILSILVGGPFVPLNGSSKKIQHLPDHLAKAPKITFKSRGRSIASAAAAKDDYWSINPHLYNTSVTNLNSPPKWHCNRSLGFGFYGYGYSCTLVKFGTKIH